MNEYRNRSGRRMAQPHQKTGLWTQYRRWVAGLTRAERIRYRLLQGAVIISLIIIAAFLILQSWIPGARAAQCRCRGRGYPVQ